MSGGNSAQIPSATAAAAAATAAAATECVDGPLRVPDVYVQHKNSKRTFILRFYFSEFRFTVPIFIELGTITGAIESHHINPEALGVTTLGVRDWYSGTGVTRAEAGLRLQLRLGMCRLLHNSDYYADMRKTR